VDIIFCERIYPLLSFNKLPTKFDQASFDVGYGIKKLLGTNNAQYRIVCKLMFNSTKLQRAEKI